MATLVRSDGTESEVHPKHGKHFVLDELQTFVGGYIEAVTLDRERTMLVNEEGKFIPKLEPNSKATALLAAAGGIPGDVVVGDVLIIGSDEWA